MTIHNLKNILIGVLIIVLLLAGVFFLKDWLRPRVINALGGYTSMKVSDTITKIDIKRDTVFFTKNVVTRVVITEPSTSKKPILPLKGKNPIDSLAVYTYHNPINDSLIQGNIITDISVSSGKIVAQSIDYKPKFPIIVKEIQTITKTVDRILENKPKAYLGVGIVATNTNQVGVSILYQTPKKWQIQAGYLKPLGNTNTSIVKDQIAITLHKLF
jgi:hypothetical protein